MQFEPQEVRLQRSARPGRPRRVAGLWDAERATIETPDAVDEAFADLPLPEQAPQQDATAPTSELIARVTTQLHQLDAQRERLATLLADLDAS